jgi:nucleoside-diphosphate-sugar epimerase
MNTSAHDRVILVTGAAGFLGSFLVRTLQDSFPTCQIISVSRSKRASALSDDRISYLHGDLRERQTWSQFPATITHVCHLAANIPWSGSSKRDQDVERDNVLPVTNLVAESSRWPRLEQIIYSSSVSVYEPTTDVLTEQSPTNPNTVYGRAKLSNEETLTALNERNVGVISLRFSSIYGYGQYPVTVLPLMVNRALDNKAITVFGDGKRTQDFVHRTDAVRAVCLAMEAGTNGVFNVGSGTPTSMYELAQVVNNVFASGRSSIIFSTDRVETDPGIKLDISKARNELKYEPSVGLEEGLKQLKLQIGERM